MTDRTRYYRPAGLFRLVPFATRIAGIGTAFMLGIWFGVLTALNPFVYSFNLLGTIALGVIAGIAYQTSRSFPCSKNRTLILQGRLLVAMSAIYANGVGWAIGLFQFEDMAFTPKGLEALASIAAAKAVLSTQGWTPTIWQPFTIWAAEAGAILCIGVAIGTWCLKTPFCTRCYSWTRDLFMVSPLTLVEDTEIFVQSLENEDFDVLESLSFQTDIFQTFMKIQTKACPRCKNFMLATCSHVTLTSDAKGEITAEKEIFCEDILINSHAFDNLQRLHQRSNDTESDSKEKEILKVSPVAARCVQQVLQD